MTYDAASAPVTKDTIYDLASVTKSIPGSCALLKLIDEGKVGLDDRLVDYVPTFGNFENKKDVRIKHVLTYTVDLDVPTMSSLKELQPEEIMQRIVSAPLKSPPGSQFIYGNSTSLFVGLIIEKVTGKTIDVFADEQFFVPLQMEHTTFFPEKFFKDQIAPTEDDPWRGRLIHGEIHDESTSVLRQKYMTTAAGLFSTAPDLLNFLEMILRGGVKKSADGASDMRFFSEHMIEQMHTQQPDLAGGATLGWAIPAKDVVGEKCSDQTFSKTGFTGTIVLVDPANDIALTLLSNRVYPKRPPDLSAINAVRKDLMDIIFS
jgi:CubicO group peptidase (beta-lactamase class C family)